MSECCSPVQSGQTEQVAAEVESCCAPSPEGQACASTNGQITACSQCGQIGKKVDSITLKAMLDVSLLAPRDVDYRFCRTADCPVVYFAGDGRQTFSKDQLRGLVHQKEPDDETVPVCYCFRHSPASIRAELLATGQSTVVEEINGGIKAGQCACEIRNPQGSCCLGNVSKVVKRIEQELPVMA